MTSDSILLKDIFNFQLSAAGFRYKVLQKYQNRMADDFYLFSK